MVLLGIFLLVVSVVILLAEWLSDESFRPFHKMLFIVGLMGLILINSIFWTKTNKTYIEIDVAENSSAVKLTYQKCTVYDYNFDICENIKKIVIPQEALVKNFDAFEQIAQESL